MKVPLAHRSAHRRASLVQSHFLSYIGEGPVVVIAIQFARRCLSLQGHLDGRRIGEIDVGPAIAIIVEYDDTPPVIDSKMYFLTCDDLCVKAIPAFALISSNFGTVRFMHLGDLAPGESGPVMGCPIP